MASLGEQLKAARKSSSKSFEDISRDTKISIRYLEAMEDNRFDVFPSSFYARGFLKIYAKYIGLDPRAVVSQYDKLAAFDDLLDPDVSHDVVIRKRSARRVNRKRVALLIVVFAYTILWLVGLLLKRS